VPLPAISTSTHVVLAAVQHGQHAVRLHHALANGHVPGTGGALLHGSRAHRFPRVRAGVDYVGVFLAAALSWAAIPGVGEAALIAAGISARHGHLDLTAVVAVAFAGASLGGIAGWLVGVRGGRRLVTAPGVLLRLRLRMLARGERFYARYGPIAVLFTPAWVAGIHNMRWSRFLIANTFSALVWAVAIGVGADLIGPSITDLVGDVGVAGAIALAGVLIVLAAVLVRSLSARRRGGAGGED
jgi:membrane protein DedA with SNARE-associated domain